MARERPYLFAMNGGEVSPLALGRVDLQRMRITAQKMTNCFPRVIGPMQFRPGTRYLGRVTSDLKTRQLPFIFGAGDTAMVELYNQGMRVAIDGTVLTRTAVSTSVTNGDFSSATGWTLTTSNGGIATIAGGTLTLNGSVRGSRPKCERSVTVAAPDRNIEHALRLVVTTGPVRLRVGSSSGGEQYIREAEYGAGTYSLAFTPTNNFFITLLISQVERDVVVDSIQVEAAGELTLPAPWLEADLAKCRFDQSGDVIFVTNTSRLYQTRRIERRHNPRSWGLVRHENKDGPYRGKTSNVQLKVSQTNGVGTMTASDAFFVPEHVGTIFRIFHSTVALSQRVAGESQFTDAIRVNGRDNAERGVSISSSGSWSGAITFQVSYDEGETWLVAYSQGSNVGTVYVPGNYNQVVMVRVGFGPGNWNSGIMTVNMGYDGGSGWGVVRVTGYNSATSVNVEVLSRIQKYDTFSNEWEEGKFSAVAGYPSAITLFDGRLWLGDNDKVYGSVSDSFDSLDLEVEGDSGPIIRSIATGPVNRALTMLGLSRLAILTSGSEAIGRSSSFDEPMTPTNFSIKDASTQGSADVMAVKMDRAGIYVQRSGKRVYILRYDVEAQDYVSVDVSKYNPTILANNVIGIAVQRQPDTRVWFWMTDGKAACLIYEPSEDVISWCRFETDGVIEDIAVLSNIEADDVFMIVKRTISGVDRRYRERLAYDTEAMGGTNNYIADAFAVNDLVASAVVSGLSHLEGKQVVAWASGLPVLDVNGAPQLFTVTGAQYNLPAAITGRVISGLYYEGLWKSTKLAYAIPDGTAISQKKQVMTVAPLLYSTHLQGVLFGQTFTKMDPLPRMIKMEPRALNSMLTDLDEDGGYDYDAFALPGSWSNDARLCMKMRAPMPAICLGTVMTVEGHSSG